LNLIIAFLYLFVKFYLCTAARFNSRCTCRPECVYERINARHLGKSLRAAVSISTKRNDVDNMVYTHRHQRPAYSVSSLHSGHPACLSVFKADGKRKPHVFVIQKQNYVINAHVE